jgi:acetoacetyl-CoA synthetase
MQDNRPLWVPAADAVARSPIHAFMARCNADFGLSLSGFEDLHAW